MEKTYDPVPLDEEQQSSEKHTLLWRVEKHVPWRLFSQDSKLPSRSLWFIQGFFFCISLTLFVLSFCIRYNKSSYLYYTSQYLPYSPAVSAVQYETTRYNVTPALDQTEFTGYGPDVDKAWNHVTYDVGDQMITPQELQRLGLDPSSLTVDNPRTGQQGYRAGVQVFHQLHCLNLLRQDSYRGYYSHHGGDIEVEPEDLRGHLDHCIEMLRINLMCQSDIGVYTFKEYEGFDGHWPDFSTLHTCRNFDAIRDWAFQNAVVFGDEE